MAMHSYMRTGPSQSQTQASSLSPDEMNGFLKDKQAWENAISLYHGQDPLDHWYNYICWYENHAHSDPELKFRETLERCLTQYEHSDYYRQDARMVRLWLKYIAMQTEPLHFYQVLYQRRTGRQVAAFYIGWASYYESREEFKDAETVFNLAFQEKAESNAELQHAHTKFTYARSMHYQRLQQQQQAQQQQQQQQQPPPPDALQQLANYTQQLPQSYAPRPQPYQQQQPPPQHASVYQQQQQYPPQQPPPHQPPPVHAQEQVAAYQAHYQDQPRYEQQQQQQHNHQPQQPLVPLEPQPACSPIAAVTTNASIQRQRNGGHHFHPYLLGQTSTPKSEANGYRRARTKVKRSKFQLPDVCSNSNSSSAADVTASSSVAAAAPSAAAGAATASASAALPIHNATFNDNANFSFSSATGLDNSNSSLALAVDRLHFRDTSQQAHAPVNKTLQAHNNNNYSSNNNGNATTATALADFSTFQENSYFATQHDTEAQERRLSKAVETIARHLAKEAIDPFNSELCRAFLTKLNFPGDDDDHASYKIVQTPLPKISNTRTLNVLEGVQFNIDKEVGRGSYGSVYKATDSRTGNVVALKYQKPPNTWEIYICDQVLKRIKEPEVLPGLMDISTAIIAPNASLIATEFSPFGSLLDINNKIRQATTKVMHESLVMHFSAQICNIVDHLHRQHIIHADIKPDNFLLMRVPSVDSPLPSLRLIDFGCAIDMSLFPDGEHTKFRKVVQTDGFTCIEMQEGRPWSYETDLFCIAATVHVMLFGEYMQPQKRGTNWDIRQKLPRYLKKHVWSKFFGELLNMQADKLPALREMRDIIEEECYRMDSELQKQIRTLSNILHRR
ncbi:dual specificity tyrosine-phosphorylation-regulated kinase mbk-2 isoform X2 [Drosophila guanche]|uniref:dual specificity tyrosine-phosphorylation-regulated kinase mbk-2 isoform X2 n=1 Tax=Drosophila guanche TaxID=7266 RepID=UPI00147183C6|nr:dual specificity tyrosine-phosphorylation-regulated kinase mbk-2 isoform X2 [Drosophila guanche]